MATTDNKAQPEAVLRLTELDVHAVRALCKHWVIIVEQQENEIVIELYAKE